MESESSGGNLQKKERIEIFRFSNVISIVPKHTKKKDGAEKDGEELEISDEQT